MTRDEVGAYKPYLWEQSTFYNGVLFREWILTKIVNGERASYSAPKFARMQERTRSQMLEDIVANLQNHAETGQIPKPYRFLLFDFADRMGRFPHGRTLAIYRRLDIDSLLLLLLLLLSHITRGRG